MTYATLQQLTDRFGEETILGLTDRATPPAGVIDAAVVDQVLANTDAVINDWLGARYVVPLAETPVQVADIAQAIAIWKLHTYDPGKKIEADYRDALQALRDIAKGLISLNAPTIAPVATGDTGARLTDRERPLTAENMRGFI